MRPSTNDIPKQRPEVYGRALQAAPSPQLPPQMLLHYTDRGSHPLQPCDDMVCSCTEYSNETFPCPSTFYHPAS